jgi:hypothetical protein
MYYSLYAAETYDLSAFICPVRSLFPVFPVLAFAVLEHAFFVYFNLISTLKSKQAGLRQAVSLRLFLFFSLGKRRRSRLVKMLMQFQAVQNRTGYAVPPPWGETLYLCGLSPLGRSTGPHRSRTLRGATYKPCGLLPNFNHF